MKILTQIVEDHSDCLFFLQRLLGIGLSYNQNFAMLFFQYFFVKIDFKFDEKLEKNFLLMDFRCFILTLILICVLRQERFLLFYFRVKFSFLNRKFLAYVKFSFEKK